ncbi:MAG: membrane dipeptidase [Planctomycetes bacterium]|nr:membrane dipeptidase [Planctomycetota bacterium]MBI3845567.1 membrane dipeptidase [Planctomycetota bacterium]
MKLRRRLGLAVLFVLFAGGASFVTWVPRVVDSHYNGVVESATPSVSLHARELHRSLLVADMHCDALLWDRDLLDGVSRGHVDVPRLVAGNVAIETFSAVTKAPSGPAFDPNGLDRVTPLIVAGRWPMRTWTSLAARALYQARQLHDLAARSGGRLTVIESASDLERYLSRRRTEREITAGVLAIEGLHALEGRFENVDAFADAGFRMMGLAHFFDNEVGGSTHSAANVGLTDLGRRVVKRMEERRAIVDVAHASPRTIDDVLAIATRPVVASHTGVRATCDTERNLSDDQLRRIAATGGLVGIGFFEGAVGGLDPSAIARAVRHAVDVAGIDHVAIGSDFDGSVRMAFDAAHVDRVTDALVTAGFDDAAIAKIMGGNYVALLERVLPQR